MYTVNKAIKTVINEIDLLSSILARSRSFVYSSAIVGNAEDAL